MMPETRAALEAIAAEHGLTLDQLISPNKFRRYVAARRECYRYLHEVRGWSTPQIGKLFRRNHSTIVVALDSHGRAEERRAAKREYARVRAAGEKPLGARRAG